LAGESSKCGFQDDEVVFVLLLIVADDDDGNTSTNVGCATGVFPVEDVQIPIQMTKLVRIFNTNIFSQIDSFIGIYK
jgi:hypothetical protein